MIKKEKGPEEDSQQVLHTVPALIKTEAPPPGTPNAPAAPTNPLAQRAKGESLSQDNTSILGKRKNDEPDDTTRKQGRGNDGQRAPPASRDTNRTHEQWGAPLTTADFERINHDLMRQIWTLGVTEYFRPDYGPKIFEVRIPKDKSWLLLGKNIDRVFALMSSAWRPVRLHTYESGDFLYVGLWFRKSQMKRKDRDLVWDRIKRLYDILRLWSRRAQDSGEEMSLADLLAHKMGVYRY